MNSDLNIMYDNNWYMKYRPLCLEDMILPDRLKNKFQKYIDNKNIPNILLVSETPGTGKTSIAKILIQDINNNQNVLCLNGSSKADRSINVGDRLEEFVSNESMADVKKCIFVDEAEGFTYDNQMALKAFIENCAENVSFVLTANNINEFEDAFLSRFQKIFFEIEPDEYQDMVNLFTDKIINILTKENIDHNPKVIFKIIRENFPSYRNCWQVLQDIYDSYGNINTYSNMNQSVINNLIEKMNSKNLSIIREYIAENPNINFSNIYSKLFSKIDTLNYDMTKSCLIIADWQRTNKCADKILHFIGCCSELILKG